MPAATPFTTAADPLLTADDVALLLGGVHPRTVHNLAVRGELGCVRLGRLRRFRASQVQSYLDRVTVSPR